MPAPRIVAQLLLVALPAPALAQGWDLIESPASSTFNGIAIADEHLAIAVGNDGTIVHFVDGDDGTVVASGTSEHLLDVYAVAGDFAVAAGIDVVLLWDGSTWSPLVETDTDTALSPVWASADRDLVLYGTLGQQFNFLCPHVPGASQQGFCRSFVQEILTLCGEDGEVTVVRRDGAIFRVDENLAELGGAFGPAFEPLVPLDLRAAWIPPGNCGLGPQAPTGIFAIEGGDEVLFFDGTGWVDTGLDTAFGQELIWLGGTSGNLLLAVGFEPAPGKGPANQGVAWSYDGTSWSAVTDLPSGTPGLTDVEARLEYSETIFDSGFEAAAAKDARPGLGVDVLAAAESGRGLYTAALFPEDLADLRVEKQLLAEEADGDGVRLTFAVDAFNAGPGIARFPQLSDYIETSSGQRATVESFTCDQEADIFIGPGPRRYVLSTATLPELPVNASLNCTMVVLLDSTLPVSNRASIGTWATPDPMPANNRVHRGWP